jgi:hypothetical protein
MPLRRILVYPALSMETLILDMTEWKLLVPGGDTRRSSEGAKVE